MMENVGNRKTAFVYKDENQITILKTSLFFPGDGFLAYDLSGELVFRVDSYGPNKRGTRELVLMDPSGQCLLTVRQKSRSLRKRWDGFLGEKTNGQNPIFSVQRSSIIRGSRLTVTRYNNPPAKYHIEGSFYQRCCTIFNEERKRVAEIRRKVDSWANVVLSKDVFSLYLEPGSDAAFAMGLVLILDRISDHGDYFVDNCGVRVGPQHDNIEISP